MSQVATEEDLACLHLLMQRIVDEDPAIHNAIINGPEEPDPALIATVTRRTMAHMESLPGEDNRERVARLKHYFFVVGLNAQIEDVRRDHPEWDEGAIAVEAVERLSLRVGSGPIPQRLRDILTD